MNDSTTKLLTKGQVEKIRENVADTRAWLDDEKADLLDDEAISGIVRDEDALLDDRDALTGLIRDLRNGLRTYHDVVHASGCSLCTSLRRADSITGGA